MQFRKWNLGALTFFVGALLLPMSANAGYTFYTVDAPSAADTSTQVSGISFNTGVAVGSYTDTTGNIQNFVISLSNPTSLLLLTPTTSATIYTGINDSNTLAGGTGAIGFTATYNGSGVLSQTSPGTPPFPGYAYNFSGINNAGSVAGFGTDSSGVTHGVVYNGSTYITNADAITSGSVQLGNLLAINNNNIAVGTYLGTDGLQHSYFYTISGSSGTATQVTDVSGSQFAQLSGVNDSGLAVGYYVDASGAAHGIIYNTATDTYTNNDFNVVINGVTEADTVINGIDNKGDLSGFYIDAAGNQHGFVALVSTAVIPEPSSVVMLAIGGVTMAGFAARRKLSRNAV